MFGCHSRGSAREWSDVLPNVPAYGVYEPVEVEKNAEGNLQGHSDVLDLDIQWQDGRLEW